MPVAHNWHQFDHGVAELVDQFTATSDAPAETWRPVDDAPAAHILAVAADLPETPAVLWDVPGVDAHVARIAGMLRSAGIGLSVALKSCGHQPILRRLAALGLSGDAATPGECRLAAEAGFGTVTACGPLFRADDIDKMLRAGIRFDAQSQLQVRQLIETNTGIPAGLRLRVPLPARLRSSTSRGADSRFGVDISPGMLSSLDDAGQQIHRLRTHTGEATPETLAFRVRYALLTAELLGSVNQVNLGGGLLRLSRDEQLFSQVLDGLAPILAPHVSAGVRFWVEPGAGLLLDNAYLVTEVIDTEPATIVDASPWNLAPWAQPSFWSATRPGTRVAGPLFGPTLYEKDRFNTTGDVPGARPPQRGERVVVTSFGAYTLVHGRQFGQIPLPRQFMITEEGRDYPDVR